MLSSNGKLVPIGVPAFSINIAQITPSTQRCAIATGCTIDSISVMKSVVAKCNMRQLNLGACAARDRADVHLHVTVVASSFFLHTVGILEHGTPTEPSVVVASFFPTLLHLAHDNTRAP